MWLYVNPKGQKAQRVHTIMVLKIIGSGNKGLANNSKKRLVFDKSRVNVINDFGTMLQRKAQLQSFCEEILKMAMSS